MSPPKPLKVIAIGDVSLNGRYHRRISRDGLDSPFALVRSAWAESDLVLGNLESPITTAPRVAPSKVTLRGSPSSGTVLREAEIQAVSLANNHTMDFGASGLAETATALGLAGIEHVGAGPEERAAREPLILTRDAGTVGLLAYCDVEQRSPLCAGDGSPGVAELRPENVLADIAALRPRVDWIIIQLHWGLEMAQIPSPEQRSLAREIARAGADLILGHHPHVLQPMELIDEVPVFYSLGNFVFSDQYWRGVGSDGRPFISRLRLHPLSRKNGWAEVVLERGRPARARFHPARLRKDLMVVPERTDARRREWEEMTSRLSACDYGALYATEAKRARQRTAWRWAWKPLHRRVEMRLFHFGLLPFAVEGT